jgi:hypothetical protein
MDSFLSIYKYNIYYSNKTELKLEWLNIPLPKQRMYIKQKHYEALTNHSWNSINSNKNFKVNKMKDINITMLYICQIPDNENWWKVLDTRICKTYNSVYFPT